MKKMVKILVLTSLFIFLISNAYGQTLIDYVGKDDGCFSWEIISREDVEGATIFNINLVSQRWKDIVWSHRLVIGVPKTIINPKTTPLDLVPFFIL
ncbi:MAG TPA: PhoPQ-activated protein PqaA family protein, partial [bacterium]|nr:PhoPQ-activated protein PqaA family protein [bacterium]